MRAGTILIAGFFVASLSHADGGLIPFKNNVQVFEPNQNALIAWNGNVEILILSTDTYASEATKALEVIPFRAEPSIKKGDPRAFEKATALINAQNRSRHSRGATAGAAPAAAAPAPAGEVTSRQQIGRHDVSVTHVVDAAGFCNWAEAYLRSQGADAPQVPAAIRAAVERYIGLGFTWFVYDVFELGTEAASNEPVQYTFSSDCLFYPLVITQTESRDVRVRLLVLTKDYLLEYPELPRERILVGLQQYPDATSIDQEMVRLSAADLRDIDPDVAGIFGGKPGVKLRLWQLVPETRGRFIHDLVAR